MKQWDWFTVCDVVAWTASIVGVLVVVAAVVWRYFP